MSTPVNFTPMSLDFGAVAPGSKGPSPTPAEINMAGGVYLDGAPAGLVTAGIAGPDAAHFTVANLSAYKWVRQYIDPGELPVVPAGHPRPRPYTLALEFVAKWDGINPLVVNKGEFVLAQVKYDTTGATGDLNALLFINCSAWDPNPVFIQLTLSIVQIKVTLSSLSVTVRQGETAALPITVQNTAGPDNVFFSLNTGAGPQGISMQNTGPNLLAGETRPVTLEFSAALDAPVVSNQELAIIQTEINPLLINPVISPLHPEPSITVLPGLITVTPAVPAVVAGSSSNVVEANLVVNFGSLRSYTELTFTGNLPPGVSLGNASFALSANPDSVAGWPSTNVAADGSTIIILPFTVLALAGIVVPGIYPIKLAWSAYNGDQTGNVQFTLLVQVPRADAIKAPWAALLCKFADNSSEPFLRSFYEDLFTVTGAGTQNMVDFFRDVSQQKLDVSGSQVFGWFTLDQKRSDYVGSGPNPQGRNDLVNWAKQKASSQGVDLSPFAVVVACMNVPTDVCGGGGTAICDNGSMTTSVLAHEMGHGYGLSHSRADNNPSVDYQDPWDVMSGGYRASNSMYTQVGPFLNASNIEGRGCLDESRVWNASGPPQTITLRPLIRYDLPGWIAARVGGFMVEFRVREGWDAAIPRPAVLIHRFQANQSYIMSGTNGNQDLVAGDVFQFGDPTKALPWARVEVVSIDAVGYGAIVRLSSR